MPPAGRVVWRPDGEALLMSGPGVREYVLATGALRRLRADGADAQYSPRGAEIVFAAGAECRDRVGVYRLPTRGGRAVRLTNDRRIRGTNTRDRMSGTELFDLILGFGGDDELRAHDAAYFGDELDGGAGNDLLYGGGLANTLRGGRGNDRLEAGVGADTLDGGAGHDVLLGGRGSDTIISADGERDRIECGTNVRGPERDVARIDGRDVVARDCERVLRR
jgi:RTX calcium-binding nonapeptide repeat (4 copies)